jgi:hypothetical protein
MKPSKEPLKSLPRGLRFGPGLLVAIAASLWVWWQFPPQSAAPRIERTALPTTSLPSAPEPEWLLSQRESLEISAAQWEKLSRLRDRWNRDTRELRGALRQASADFNRGLSSDSSLTMQQIQERAAPVSELSRQLAAARAAWWDEAAQILSRPQRQRAEENWAQRFANKARPSRKE